MGAGRQRAADTMTGPSVSTTEGRPSMDDYVCSHCGARDAPIDSEHCPDCEEHYRDIRNAEQSAWDDR
jgi:ribosomal protein L40E